jgi:hypothetical protein
MSGKYSCIPPHNYMMSFTLYVPVMLLQARIERLPALIESCMPQSTSPPSPTSLSLAPSEPVDPWQPTHLA